MQKSQTKRGGLPCETSGIFRDWIVQNAVFLCSRYVALPAIIPHGRGEGERFVYSRYGDVGHSVSHIEVGDKNRLTFTPQTDCDVFVLCAVSVIWGYDGSTVTMRVNCSQLETASAHVGKFSGGNTESHQIVFWSVFRGAKAGVTYSFSMSESGAAQGDKERTALCMAVHL